MPNGKGTIILIIIAVVFGLIFVACIGVSSSSSSSSYQLHNQDGSLNMDYVNDMNEYFEKHPEKLPK